MTDNIPESLFTSEHSVVEWLAELHSKYKQEAVTPLFANRAMAEKAQDLLYFATGVQFEVRQVIPPPTRPRAPRDTRRRWY